MAAELAGTAAIRLVPSLTGFRQRAQTELQRQKGLAVDVDIRPKVDTSIAKKQLDKFRAKEEADAIELKARIDEADFKRQFQRVEHVFERSAFAKALRLQVKVIGADALYGLAGAAGAAAAALQSVGGAALIIPGALAQAGVAAGVLAAAFGGLGKAMTQVRTAQDQAQDKTRAYASASRDSASAQRDVQRAHRDVGRAVKDAIRNYEDLAHAVRGTSLDEADAILNVQESMDRLAQGGHENVLALRRDQLRLRQDLHALDGVRMQNKRTVEDFNEAQRQGIQDSDKVVAALDAVTAAQDRMADAAGRMADANQSKLMGGEFARLAPAAQEFVLAVTAADGVWAKFTGDLQQTVMLGQAKNLIDTLNTSLTNFGPNLQAVAGELNGFFKDLGEELRSDTNQGFIKGIIGDTRNTLAELRRGLDPAIEGILRLADAGGDHMPTLMRLINGFLDRFNEWTKRVAESGQLDKWITQGLTAFEQMVNIGTDLIGIVSAVADAWVLAGGESTGLIGNAENLTKRIREWVTSPQGAGTLVTHFKRIREWVGQMGDAFSNMWPTIKEVANTVREWSVTFFTILGFMFRMTAWVEEHTGLVKLLVAAYLSIRTITPIWHALTGAATAYANTMARMSQVGGPAGSFARNSVTGLATVQTAMGKTGTAAQTLAGTFGTAQRTVQTGIKETGKQAGALATGPLTRMQNAFMNLVTPINSTAGQIRSLNGFLPAASQNMTTLGTAGTTASKQVGGGPVGKVGLFGAVSALGAFLGPMAAGIVAVGGIMWAIDKMGEAHRNAARDAQAQNNQLLALKGTLDSFSGAFTANTAIQAGKDAQQFQTQGFGTRNVLQDIARTGLATPEQLIGATNPVNQAQRDKLTGELRAGAAEKLAPFLDKEYVSDASTGAKSTLRKRYEGMGLSEQDLIGILTGDQAAVDKWNAAAKNQPGGEFGPGATPNAEAMRRQAQQTLPPEAFDYLTSLQYLNVASNANVVGGQDIQFGNTAALGPASLKPTAVGYGPNPRVTKTSLDTAMVETSEPVTPEFVKNFPTELGTVQLLPGGRAQIMLTREGTLRDIDFKAAGGMVRGVGSGTSDSNIIAASRGEFILRKQAVDRVGVPTLDAINHGRLPGFNVGGLSPFPLTPSITDIILPPPPAGGGTQHGGVTPPGFLPPTMPAPSAPPPPPVVPRPPTPPINTPPPGLPQPATTTPPATTDVPHLPTGAPASPSVSTPVVSPIATGPTMALPAGYGPGPLGPIQVGQSETPILSYLQSVATQSGLRVGSGYRPEAGSHHSTNTALDIGNGPDTLPLAQWWIQDPSRVASTSELILDVPGWDPAYNIKNGQFVGARGNVYDEGTLAGHDDHMHLALSGIPSSVTQQLQGFPTSTGGLTLPGGTPQEAQPQSFMDLIISKYREAYKPENIAKFLMGQAQNVGSTLMGIGTQFLQGFTGIDLSGVMGHGQSLISHFTGSGSTGGGSGNASSLTAGSPVDNAVTGNMAQFDAMGGVDMSSIMGIMGGSGAGGVAPGAGPGVQKWMGLIQQVAQQLAMQGLISQSDVPAYVAAVARQMEFESKGDPKALNPKDSDGLPALGLMQFKQATFDSHVPAGFKKDPFDPAAAIAASIMYSKSKGGPSYMTGKHGYASGGPAGGLIRVSRGEYRMGPKAVSRYGLGAMYALNSYAGGGFPLGAIINPRPVPAPRPAPPPPVPDAKQLVPPPPKPITIAPKPTVPPVRPPGPPGGQAQQVAPAPAPVAPTTGPTTGSEGGASAGAIPNFSPFMPGMPTGQQPMPAGMVMPDARSEMQGPAPKSNQHNIGWLDRAIKEGSAHGGQLAGTALSMGMGSMGMPGGAQAGQMLQAGIAMAGQVAAGVMNVISSAGVGTIMGIGTKATPSGAPLLPQNPVMGFGALPNQNDMFAHRQQPGMQQQGGPMIMNVYNGGIHTSNMDEWQRRQQLLERQQEQPLTNTFVH